MAYTQNNFKLADSANIDAFSRLRVSNPTSLFTIQTQYNESTIQMESGYSGNGITPSYNRTTRLTSLTVSGGTTGTSFMQSYSYIPYQPGNCQLIFITGSFIDSGITNTYTDFGYGDSLNGIFYRQSGTTGVYFVRRTSTSGSIYEEVISQANWNLDKMDGTSGLTNPSRILLDQTKDFIMVIDLQYLGMGRVRVGLDIDGVIYYVHQFTHANKITGVYMQQATLPISITVNSTNTPSSPKTVYFKCASVLSEGGSVDVSAYNFSSPEASVTASSGARTHLLSLRPKTTFNGIPNRQKFIIDNIALLVTGNDPVYWELCVGANFSGGTATWNDVNTNYSGMEYGTGGTPNFGSGLIVIDSGYCPGSTNQGVTTPLSREIPNRFPISLNRAGNVRDMGTISLFVSGVGGSTATRGRIAYREVR